MFISRSTLISTLLASALLLTSALAQDAADIEETVTPDLQALQSDWWTYFEGPREDVETRIAAIDEIVSAQVEDLEVQNQETARSLLATVRENFVAYLNVLDTTDVAMPGQPPEAASYLLEELLELADVAREARTNATEERLEVEREERTLAGARRQRDTAFREYAASAEGDERWLLALRLVQARVVQAISAERLELLTERYEAGTDFADETEERVDLARQRLAPTGNETELADLEQRVAVDETAVAAARAALASAQVAASTLDSDTAQGRSQGRLQQQRFLTAEIDFALAEERRARSSAKYWWTALRTDTNVDLAVLETQVLEWSESVRNIEQRAPEWQSDTEAELLAVQSQNRDGLDQTANNLLDQRLETAQETLAKIVELEATSADLELLMQVVDGAIADYSGAFRSWLSSMNRAIKTAFMRVTGLADTTLFSVGETPVTGGDILRVIIILALALLLSRGIQLAIRRVGDSEYSGTQASMYTVGRLTHYAIVILAVFVALTSIGLDFSNLALVAGALSVGIGFGLQSIVNNFVSGLIILFEHSLRVGDYIELDTELTGTVKAINVRSTLINTNDNIDIVVPNSEFVTTRLTNWTLGERILRVRIPFGVAYGSDKELVKKAAMEAAAEVPYTLTNMKGRETDVWLVEFGDNSLNFLLLVWVNRQGARRPTRTRAAYLWALETALGKYGIEIPFPQRDLHLRSGWPPKTTDDEIGIFEESEIESAISNLAEKP
ncbi:MAG: mechanosensitive ion channel domain-containing protein [Woeseiaceae bacterium]